MRFELFAAYSLGVGLPLLEVLRRGTRVDTISGYVDDFIAGGLLLYAAWSVSSGKSSGPTLMVMAWAVVCGGLYYSFFGQLKRGAAADVSGLSNVTVVLVKGVLFTVAIACLLLSVRNAGRSGSLSE